MTNSRDTLKQTKPDQTNHTLETDITVGLSCDDTVQATLVPRFCWLQCVFGCTNCNGHDFVSCCRGNKISHTVLGYGSVIRFPQRLVCCGMFSMSAL